MLGAYRVPGVRFALAVMLGELDKATYRLRDCALMLGAGLLGFDLVRLQHRLRREAADRRSAIDSMADEYGGIALWTAETKRNARYIPQSAYDDYHAQDPVSYNVGNLTKRAKELGECVNGLGEHFAKVTTYLGDAADAGKATAALSTRYSITALVLLVAGFVLQTLGTNLTL